MCRASKSPLSCLPSPFTALAVQLLERRHRDLRRRARSRMIRVSPRQKLAQYGRPIIILALPVQPAEKISDFIEQLRIGRRPRPASGKQEIMASVFLALVHLLLQVRASQKDCSVLRWACASFAALYEVSASFPTHKPLENSSAPPCPFPPTFFVAAKRRCRRPRGKLVFARRLRNRSIRRRELRPVNLRCSAESAGSASLFFDQRLRQNGIARRAIRAASLRPCEHLSNMRGKH